MIANIIWDVILAGLLIAGIVIGIKKGFVSTVAKPVKFIAAIVLALFLAAPIGGALVKPIIGPAISNKISDALIEEYSDITAETASEELPTLIKAAAGICGIDISDVASASDGEEVIISIVDSVTTPVVDLMATVIGFIILYFVLKILLSLLMSFINSMVDRGVVGAVNKILGCVFTLILAVCAAWVLTSLTEFILNIPIIAKAEWVGEFTGGPIYRFFKSLSPVDLLLSF